MQLISSCFTGRRFVSVHIRSFVNCSFAWHRITPSSADPRSEPIAITGPVLGHIQPHIRSTLSRGCTIIPLSTGTGSGERGQTQGRRLEPKGYPVRSPGSVRTDQALRIRNCVSAQFVFQAVFMMAPSMTTPEFTYFQSATSNLRASATIIGVFRRPALHAMRSLNHSVKVNLGWWRSHNCMTRHLFTSRR